MFEHGALYFLRPAGVFSWFMLAVTAGLLYGAVLLKRKGCLRRHILGYAALAMTPLVLGLTAAMFSVTKCLKHLNSEGLNDPAFFDHHFGCICHYLLTGTLYTAALFVTGVVLSMYAGAVKTASSHEASER